MGRPQTPSARGVGRDPPAPREGSLAAWSHPTAGAQGEGQERGARPGLVSPSCPPSQAHPLGLSPDSVNAGMERMGKEGKGRAQSARVRTSRGAGDHGHSLSAASRFPGKQHQKRGVIGGDSFSSHGCSCRSRQSLGRPQTPSVGGVGKDPPAPREGSLAAYPPISPPGHSGVKPDSRQRFGGSAGSRLTEYWEHIRKLLLQSKSQQGRALCKTLAIGKTKETHAALRTVPPKSPWK